MDDESHIDVIEHYTTSKKKLFAFDSLERRGGFNEVGRKRKSPLPYRRNLTTKPPIFFDVSTVSCPSHLYYW